MHQEDLERLQPYLEMYADKLREAIQDNEELADLREFIRKHGFNLGLIISIVAGVTDEKKKDAQFLQEMKIKYY